MTSKKIAWEKHYYEFNNLSNGLDNSNENEVDELPEFDSGFGEFGNEQMYMKMFAPEEPKPVMNTPFGTLEVHNDMNPYKQYQFWMAHTNFTIDDDIRNTIKETEGVEVLRIISRYRFLIAIGRLFDLVEVRRDIENQVCGQKIKDIAVVLCDGKTIKDVVGEISHNKYYAAYFFPNGQYDSISSDTITPDFEERKQLMLKAQKESNGVFISNEQDRLTQ
jgi:hypothetical protein